MTSNELPGPAVASVPACGTPVLPQASRPGPRYLQIIEALERDPFQPSLRLHPLRGPLEGKHAVSLTYAYRITLTLAVSEQTVTLLDIGSHDEVYGRAR